MTHLLNLPDEIFLNDIFPLLDDLTLFYLSHTNSRLRPIANEVLAKRHAIPIKGLKAPEPENCLKAIGNVSGITYFTRDELFNTIEQLQQLTFDSERESVAKAATEALGFVMIRIPQRDFLHYLRCFSVMFNLRQRATYANSDIIRNTAVQTIAVLAKKFSKTYLHLLVNVLREQLGKKPINQIGSAKIIASIAHLLPRKLLSTLIADLQRLIATQNGQVEAAVVDAIRTLFHWMPNRSPHRIIPLLLAQLGNGFYPADKALTIAIATLAPQKIPFLKNKLCGGQRNRAPHEAGNWLIEHFPAERLAQGSSERSSVDAPPPEAQELSLFIQ